jgi:hypothetical protein
MKNRPTWHAVVLIAHGENFESKGSNVFEVTFPLTRT